MTELQPAPDDDERSDRVRQWLGAAGQPPMPTDVAARLDTVIADESRRRSEIQAAKADFPDRTRTPRTLLPAEAPAAPAPRSRWRQPLAVAAVAAVTAAAVGVAGYTLSASAGFNEPVANSVVRLQSSTLAEQAEVIAATRNLSAHTFSGAWRCVRDVTKGRITGITPAYVDDTAALLVYTRTDGQTWVTVVTGCPEPGAVARESVRLS